MRALLPGSFDPVTHGHLDLINRAAAVVESLVVGVAVNVDKHPLFAEDERVELLRAACVSWPTVEVWAFRGLVVDAVRQCGAGLIIRGVRDSADGLRELQMAQTNRRLAGFETLLLPTDPQWAYVSSSLVKEIARFGGDITPFVPAMVAERIQTYYRQQL